MMQIIKSQTQFYIEEDTAVTIGKFDGIHEGHKLLLANILNAKREGLKSVVFTFDPPPAVFFGAEDKQLTTLAEKEMLFAQMGVDYLIEYPFDVRTAGVEPEQFVRDVLCEQMRAKRIVCGEDVSFGKKGLGDASLLKTLSMELGFEVKLIEKIQFEGEELSSSLVRAAVLRGEMVLALKMLGEPYFISGEVKTGNRIGRTIGFPTINVLPDHTKLLPPRGVYFSNVEIDGKAYNGITNIGKKPTIGKDYDDIAETFIYDFSENIYGKTVKVQLLQFVRAEMKFDSFEHLKAAIDADVEKGRYYFAKT